MRFWLQTREGSWWVWLGNLFSSTKVVICKDGSRKARLS